MNLLKCFNVNKGSNKCFLIFDNLLIYLYKVEIQKFCDPVVDYRIHSMLVSIT